MRKIKRLWKALPNLDRDELLEDLQDGDASASEGGSGDESSVDGSDEETGGSGETSADNAADPANV